MQRKWEILPIWTVQPALAGMLIPGAEITSFSLVKTPRISPKCSIVQLPGKCETVWELWSVAWASSNISREFQASDKDVVVEIEACEVDEWGVSEQQTQTQICHELGIFSCCREDIKLSYSIDEAAATGTRLSFNGENSRTWWWDIRQASYYILANFKSWCSDMLTTIVHPYLFLW